MRGTSHCLRVARARPVPSLLRLRRNFRRLFQVSRSSRLAVELFSCALCRYCAHAPPAHSSIPALIDMLPPPARACVVSALMWVRACCSRNARTILNSLNNIRSRLRRLVFRNKSRAFRRVGSGVSPRSRLQFVAGRVGAKGRGYRVAVAHLLVEQLGISPCDFSRHLSRRSVVWQAGRRPTSFPHCVHPVTTASVRRILRARAPRSGRP